jgi:branched-chain amino acid transport system ATP-binding protein
MPLLELQKLTKYFGGLTAVNELDLSIEKGQIIGLIGPNGAGKTTAFNTITGKFRPSSGKVIFKGENITGLKPHTLVGLGLARSFQQTLLFGEMTVLDNIIVGFHMRSQMGFQNALLNTASTRRQQKQLLDRATEIASFLELVHVKNELAKNLPHGYQRLLGVGIALATDPELLLLDEPATGMNPEETDRMLLKIKDMNKKGLTILLVEHSMRLVMNVCERIVVLNFGRKIAEGLPEEICKNKEVITAYLGSGYATRC